ncbi:MAG: Hsp20/alpha crystallin family protein [Pseudomonadota bacterium]
MGDVFLDRLWPEWQRDMGEEWAPAVNFYDKEGKYFLTAELPGLTKEDIKLSLDQGVLTITGKKASRQEEEGANYYLKEAAYGVFSRGFRLPGEIEEGKIVATFKDGVLTLEMPHKEKPTSRTIEIK